MTYNIHVAVTVSVRFPPRPAKRCETKHENKEKKEVLRLSQTVSSVSNRLTTACHDGVVSGARVSKTASNAVLSRANRREKT